MILTKWQQTRWPAIERELERVVDALRRLKPIEQEVIRRRFGLDDGREVTLQEIADSHGLSRERIRQIQQQALRKVQRVMRQDNAL